MKPITKDEIKKEFSRVGLKNGSIVMVHTSLGKIGYVCGGAQTVIEALSITAVDPGGMAPHKSDIYRDIKGLLQ